jgi:hypothetical protein
MDWLLWIGCYVLFAMDCLLWIVCYELVSGFLPLSLGHWGYS